MIVGFGRAAKNENEDLRVLFLDFPDLFWEGRLSAVLRPLCTRDMLHSAEPEVVVDAAGRQLVPRLRQMPEPNARYNSVERPTIQEVDANQTALELHREESGSYVLVPPRLELETHIKGGSGLIELRTTHTTLAATKTVIGHQFAALGVDSDQHVYLTFTSTLRSAMQVPRALAVRCDDVSLPPAALLALVMAVSAAQCIVGPLPRGQRFAVHSPSEYAAAVLSAYASIKGAKVTFTTDLGSPSQAAPASATSWIPLAPFLAPSDVLDVLPRALSCFVDLSVEHSPNASTILSALPLATRVETTDRLFMSPCAGSSSVSGALSAEDLAALVQDLRQVAAMIKSQPAETVTLEDVVRGTSPKDPFTVVDWRAFLPASLPMRVTRLDPRSLLKQDKTYWLCGMSGGLGLSLCDWL
ncbi:putative polyketide synthase, partial [Emericellopsis cladophorae]